MTEYVTKEKVLAQLERCARDPYHETHYKRDAVINTIRRMEAADVVAIDTVSELFNNEAPCNYGIKGVSVDDFMYKECGDWCADNCGKVSSVECWKHFLKAWEENKKEWLNEFKD